MCTSRTQSTQVGERPTTAEATSCACCATEAGSATGSAERSLALVQTTYLVTGLTCHHCATSVTEELEALDEVSAVQVDVVPGGESSVRVASTEALGTERVRTALSDAGDYAVSGRR
ncbi:cation transporter [uncultured Serinicoccus sp.]|uniref:heavy-metal-associated domain-containing protein n=1 Tax=uncultured Serinicoccus sp. TaxID=735514 RepID=UPI0026301960|nr:cation transporter [uncultured Serinicoccus sp.]